MTVALTSIKISTNFDSGNIQVLDASDAYQLLLAIKPDTRSQHFQWFHFKAEGMHVGHTHTFRLSNAGKSSYKHAWSGYNAVASYDHVNWFRVPTRFDGEILHISLETREKHAWFAYFEPYSRERHAWLIEQALKYAGTKLLATGKSVEGRDIQLLRRGKGGEGRRKVWIIAQQHPGEHMAQWFMEGIIERLQQDGDAEVKKLLKVADLYLVPNMNPDGAFHGHLRTNAAGQDSTAPGKAPARRTARKCCLCSSKWRSTVSICSSISTATKKSPMCSPPLAKATRATPRVSRPWKNTSAAT